MQLPLQSDYGVWRGPDATGRCRKSSSQHACDDLLKYLGHQLIRNSRRKALELLPRNYIDERKSGLLDGFLRKSLDHLSFPAKASIN